MPVQSTLFFSYTYPYWSRYSISPFCLMLFQMPLPYLILSNPDLFQDCKSETNQSISQLIKNQKFPSWCMLCCVSLVLKRVCVSGGLEVCLFVCVCVHVWIKNCGNVAHTWQCIHFSWPIKLYQQSWKAFPTMKLDTNSDLENNLTHMPQANL